MASENNQLIFIRSRLRFYREMIIYNDRLITHIRSQNTVMEAMIESLEAELVETNRRGDINEAIRVDPSLAPPVLRRQVGMAVSSNTAFDEYNLRYNNQNHRRQ